MLYQCFVIISTVGLVIIEAPSTLTTLTTLTTRSTTSIDDDPYIPPNKTTSANHTALLQEFVKVFAGNDEVKKSILMKTDTISPETSDDCYLKVFDTFKAHCLYYYYQLKTVDAFKSLFHRICKTNWLQTETINQMITKTCAKKPYLLHNRPFIN